MLIWRLVIEKMASLEELETIWNLDDVLRATAILDMRLDLIEEASRKGAMKNGRS